MFTLKCSWSVIIMFGLCAMGDAQVIQRPIRPSDTDNAIVTFDVDSHYVYINPDVESLQALVVHLPGSFGEPKRATVFGEWAANLGFHSIGLMYPNAPTVGSFCTNNDDPQCFEAVRREIVEGIDYSNEVDILPSESILSRTRALLLYLSANYPNENWAQFLTEDNQLRYDRILFSGHSQGGGHAALIAKYYPIARALCFSSPKDWRNATDAPPMWLQPIDWITEVDHIFAFNHELDEHEQQLVIWQTMGLDSFGAPVIVDNTSAPFDNSHQLTTNYNVPAGDEHGCTITDNKTPILNGIPVFGEVWTYMLTHDLPSEVAEPYTDGLPSVGVFPNPCAADQLNVRSSSRGMLSIYDAMGRICLTQYQHQPTVVYDVAHWPSGMYTVVFDSGRQRMIAKWMKQ